MRVAGAEEARDSLACAGFAISRAAIYGFSLGGGGHLGTPLRDCVLAQEAGESAWVGAEEIDDYQCIEDVVEVGIDIEAEYLGVEF